MALKNQPEFEAEPETTTTATKEQTMTKTKETAQQAAAADAGVQATTAVAKAAVSSTAVAPSTGPKKMTVAFADKKDVFDTDTVAALSMATPRVTAEQGALRVKSRNEKLGTSIKLEVVSWNHRWAVGCGEEKMNDEMKELFRVSYDNKTIYGESATISEYTESLVAQGYEKAKSSPYADLFGYIVENDKGVIPEDERELVLVQLSATSLGNFTAFCVSRGLLESRGMAQPNDVIEITAEDRTKGSMSFTNMSFKAVK